MRAVRITPIASLVVVALALVLWLHHTPPGPPTPSTGPATTKTSALAPLRIGLIPERDLMKQRERYRFLADYIAKQLGRPVELATLTTYEAILQDFSEKRVDGAFLGSLIALLTVDRMNGRVVLKPETLDGRSEYRGVIFVLDSSPVRRLEDLAGRSIGVLRTTTGGNLFPMVEMIEHGVLHGPNPPRLVWCGTHDAVIQAVIDGSVEVGAVKDLRLDEFIHANPSVKIRRLATSEAVPNNALVLRADVADKLADPLRRILLNMDQTAEGRKVLTEFGAARFLPCAVEEYHAIYEMIEKIGPEWDQLGISGPPPRRAPSAPATRPRQ